MISTSKLTSKNSILTASSRLLFAATVFLSAYLLFQIQPLVGKIVTAQYGGAAAVWCVCLLFFQTALLGGYTLTLFLVKLPVKKQCIFFAAAIALSACFLNVPDFSEWRAGSGEPMASLMKLLTIHLMLPCVLLSMISGLMQSWFARTCRQDPYHLYSISNIGSISALLLYPVLMEPFFGLNAALQTWRSSYVILALLGTGSALLTFNANTSADSVSEGPSESESPPRLASILTWISLSALGCAILLTYTTYLTQDVAPVPLLWVLPLCLYLLSFVICFGRKAIRGALIYVYLGPLLWILDSFSHHCLPLDVLCVLGFIFCFCMALNIEIVRNKPSPTYLPVFYLAIALGGVIGALSIDILAPLVFNYYAERHIIIFLMLLLCCFENARNNIPLFNNRWSKSIMTIVLFTTCLATCGMALLLSNKNVIARQRNFYGCLTVNRTKYSTYLNNGGIIHGSQSLSPAKRRQPTEYYSIDSGLGIIDGYIRDLRGGGPINYGIVGLGAGTIAAYGKEGDKLTFYEIDKDVEKIARSYFTYLKDTPASVDVVIGDARKTMEEQKPNNYDLLVVDAFNSDAVPVHLLSKEAIELYLSHIKSDGILLIHISNRYVNLEPVTANIAQTLGLDAFRIDSKSTHYVAISRSALADKLKTRLRSAKAHGQQASLDTSVGIWTDDYNNMLGAIISKIRH